MGDIWSWNNAVDAPGTVISSSTGSAGGLEVANIRDPRVGKPWRAGTMPATLTIMLPASGGVSIVGLFGVNFSSVGDVTLTLEMGGTSVWSATTTGENGKAVFVLTAPDGSISPVNAQRLIVSASGTVPLEVGRVWIGGADWESRVAHTMGGSNWQIEDLSRQSTTPIAGAFIIDHGETRLRFTASYDALYPEEYADVLYRMDRERGKRAQMLFIPAPTVYDTSRFSVLGYLTDTSDTAFQGFLRASRTMTIMEAG